MIPVMLILAGAAIFYYHCLAKRVFGLLEIKLCGFWKYALWILSVVLGIFSFNLFSIAGIYLLHFFVISLICYLIDFAFFRKKSEAKRKRLVFLLVIPLILSGAVLGYGYANIRNTVRTYYRVNTQKDIEKDYRIVFLSDIHYGTIVEKEDIARLVKRVNKENADIVILGGDITDEATEKAEFNELFSALGKISSRYGIYFVWGNHDRQTYSDEKVYTDAEIYGIITRNGIKILEDEAVYINEDITLAGRNDYGMAMRGGKRAKLKEILKGADKEKYIITADHQPIAYDEAEKETDLILSGHTHAGQVFPAGYFIKLMKTADLWYGHQRTGKMDAVVSSGVAGWGYPIRTQKHSEYVVIDIVR